MKAFIATVAVVAVMALFAGSVQAHGCGYGGYGHGHYVQPHLHWHDTSHWDYVPPTIIDHGCHYHVVPGYYQFHQTGHYHLHY